MSKKKPQTPRRKSPNMVLIAGIALAAGAGLAVMAFGRAGSAEAIRPAEYVAQFSEREHVLLDVRTPEEFASGHIPGALNISVQTLSTRLAEVP